MKGKREFAKEMGIRILLLRDSKNFTREQLAELAAISSKYLYELESGRKNCSSYILYSLAHSLDISTEYLMTGTEAPTSDIKKNPDTNKTEK